MPMMLRMIEMFDFSDLDLGWGLLGQRLVRSKLVKILENSTVLGLHSDQEIKIFIIELLTTKV